VEGWWFDGSIVEGVKGSKVQKFKSSRLQAFEV
jgi:hypothetical protein